MSASPDFSADKVYGTVPLKIVGGCERAFFIKDVDKFSHQPVFEWLPLPVFHFAAGAKAVNQSRSAFAAVVASHVVELRSHT